MIILFKYCADVENYEIFSIFGFIYIYIYIDNALFGCQGNEREQSRGREIIKLPYLDVF